MEFIRSERVRMMINNYTYFPDLDDPAFLGQVFKGWKDEVRQYEEVHDLERKVQMGKSQVPWSLGTLKSAKSLKRMNVAMATALLCTRGCKDRMDFLHPLRGIIRARSVKLRSSDFKTEYYRIAWECLKVGDYSPLLITPFMGAIERRGPGHSSEFGYSDVFTWQLGQEVHPPTLVARPEWGSMTQAFSSAAKLALEIDGPDVRDFIAALGRTHPGNVSTSMEILEEKNEVNHLRRVLNKLYNSPEIPSWPTDGKDSIKWLGDVLSFSKLRPGDDQTVLGDNAARYGTSHCRPHDYTVEFILACQTPIRSQGPPPLKSKDIGSILVAINRTRLNNMATVTILTMLSQCLLNSRHMQSADRNRCHNSCTPSDNSMMPQKRGYHSRTTRNSEDNITAHYFRASKYLLLTERKFRGDMNNPSQHSLMTKTPMLSQACDLTDSIVEAMITSTG
ncbi:hypothetical protein ACKLNR_011143 [Fusarium oxysporum f. sp. zingiberi]